MANGQVAWLVRSSSHLLALSPCLLQRTPAPPQPLHRCTVLQHRQHQHQHHQQQRQQQWRRRCARLEPKPACSSSTRSPGSLTCRMWDKRRQRDIGSCGNRKEKLRYSCVVIIFIYLFFWRPFVLPGKRKSQQVSSRSAGSR